MTSAISEQINADVHSGNFHHYGGIKATIAKKRLPRVIREDEAGRDLPHPAAELEVLIAMTRADSPATQEHIAGRTSLSRSTVSRVLEGDGGLVQRGAAVRARRRYDGRQWYYLTI